MMEPNVTFQWEGYKGYKDSGIFEFPRITVLLGNNSSGKSSLVQPLLLLKQTLENSDRQSALTYSGQFVKASCFADLVHAKHERSEIKFTLGLHWHRDGKTPHKQPYGPGVFKFSFTKGDYPLGAKLQSLEIQDFYGRTLVERARQRNGRFSLRIGNGADRAVRNRIQPAAVKKALSTHQPYGFLFDESYVIRELAPFKNNRAGIIKLKDSDLAQFYIQAMGYTRNAVVGFLNRIKYVGPLRHEPERYIEFSGDQADHSAHKNPILTQLFKKNNGNLSKKVSRWLKKMGIANGIQVDKIREGLGQILVESIGTKFKANLVESGFGVSQILPILIEGLSSSKRDLVIVEQPELHLNPALQTSIAEFLVESSKNGPSYVIETHSEHLLNRLKYLIRKGRISNDEVGVYFTEPSGSQFKATRVPVNADGSIPMDTWPKGFFDEAITEAFMFAGAKGNK
jgi:predicted ATPase